MANDELMASLIDSINALGERVGKLEESLNMGRGAFKLFMVLLSTVGVALGAVKLFWK